MSTKTKHSDMLVHVHKEESKNRYQIHRGRFGSSGQVLLRSDPDLVWAALEDDLPEDHTGIKEAWSRFVVSAAVGDIFQITANIYVVKLGLDWAP